jgi:hypothetical protein
MDLMGYLTAEMEVWSAHHLVTNKVALATSHPLGDIAAAFVSIVSEHRKAAACELIKIQKRFGSRDLDVSGKRVD